MNIVLSPKERAFLAAYRASPENIQRSICKLLDVPCEVQEDSQSSSRKRARTRIIPLSLPPTLRGLSVADCEINVFDRYRIERAATTCLKQFAVDPERVELQKIIKGAGIHLVRNSEVNALPPGQLGRCMTDGKTWHVVYDDTLPAAERRFTVAHELGHIFLRHDEVYGNLHLLREKEADLFAEQLLKDHLSLQREGATNA